jgi:allantoinase
MENERYAYWPLPERPPIRWPNGARVAFWIIPNIEHFRFDRPFARSAPGMHMPDVPGFALRDYGPRVGIWRMMDLFDKYGIRGTVALNSDVCRFQPQIIRAGEERGWEWMGHGISNSEPLPGMDEQQERETIRTVVTTIAEHTGKPPRGWLGPGLGETYRTPELLAEAGIEYVCDWTADDQPFPMRVPQGRLISIPYSTELNDIPAFLVHGLLPEQFCQAICDQFDVLYAEGAGSGRVMSIALHPYIIAQPYRVKYLERALQYITRHKDVWLTTGGEIADWYYQHYYDAAPK